MAKKAFVYDGTQWVDIAQSTTDLSQYPNMTTTPISGFRNAIINGDFRINQRAFTSTTTNNAYGHDRWMIEVSGGCTYTTQAFTLGNAIPGQEPINYARLVTTGQSGTGVYSILEQRIEDVRTFAGQTITLSFWARANSGTPKVSAEFNQFWGSSATTNNNAGSVTLSTTWQRYSLTTTLGSASGKTIAGNHHLGLLLWVSAGTDYSARTNSIGIQSNTFEFWGVQVEKGSIATPFEQRPIGTELALCQRYYERYQPTSISSANFGNPFAAGGWNSTTQADATWVYKTLKRSLPTISAGTISHFRCLQYGVSWYTPTAVNVSEWSETAARVMFTTTGGGAAGQAALFTIVNTAGWIAADAEL